jgi:hypothetical protein
MTQICVMDDRREGKQMRHEQVMIVAFAAAFLALVTGFALMLS